MKFIFISLAALFLGGCTVSSQENLLPEGFLSDTQKYQTTRAQTGSVAYLSRAEVLQGSGRGVARIICNNIGYRNMVCRVRRENGVLVVYAARDVKLQRHLRDPSKVFAMVLQPYLRYGAAPVYIDFGYW